MRRLRVGCHPYGACTTAFAWILGDVDDPLIAHAGIFSSAGPMSCDKTVMNEHWQLLDNANTDTILIEDLESLVMYMKECGRTRIEGKYLNVSQTSPDLWVVQKHIERGFWRGKKTQVNMVLKDDGGGLFTLVRSHEQEKPDRHDTCKMVGILTQLSGTCYFNSVVNMLCLGHRTSSIVMKAIQRHLATSSKADLHSFYKTPLDLNVCPRRFSWLDTLRLFYAIISPQSPTALSSHAVEPGYNIFAESIYASKFRRRHNSNVGTAEVGHEGGSALEGILHMLSKLDVTFAQEGDKNILFPDVLITSKIHGPVVQKNYIKYHLDTCSFGILIRSQQNGVLLVNSEHSGHAVTGVFCKNQPMILDSAYGTLTPFKWPTAKPIELLSYFQTYGQRWGYVEGVLVNCAIYIRENALGALK